MILAPIATGSVIFERAEPRSVGRSGNLRRGGHDAALRVRAVADAETVSSCSFAAKLARLPVVQKHRSRAAPVDVRGELGGDARVQPHGARKAGRKERRDKKHAEIEAIQHHSH